MRRNERYDRIELVLSDVDGVLTDGAIIFNDEGIESKQFSVRDGQGIKLWQQAGFQFGILTARSSQIVARRAAELGIDIVRQGCEEKLAAALEVIQQQQLQLDQVCYIGDDLADVPVIRHVGLGVAVADAVAEVKSAADLVTTTAGGAGAVRELLETLLKATNRWDGLIRKYTEQQ